MPATSVLLNLLWIIFGGVEMAAGWLLTIYTLLPFGHTVTDRPSGAIGGTLGFIGNLIWRGNWRPDVRVGIACQSKPYNVDL